MDPVLARLLHGFLTTTVPVVATSGLTCFIVLRSMRGFYTTFAKEHAAEITEAIIDRITDENTRLKAENKDLKQTVEIQRTALRAAEAGINMVKEAG